MKHILRAGLLLGALLTGCKSTVREIGTVPHTSIVAVRTKVSGGLDGTSITALSFVDTNAHTLVSPPTLSAAGNGLVEALVNASGDIAGSAVWGAFRNPDKTQVMQSGGGAEVTQELKTRTAVRVDDRHHQTPPKRSPQKKHKSPKDKD